MPLSKMKIRIITFDKNSIFNLKVDEEKKVDAVRDFYAEAAENKVAFASAERMLFLGKFICFHLMFDPMMDPLMDLVVNIYVFSSSWSSCLYPSLHCHLLGLRAHDVHGRQLEKETL